MTEATSSQSTETQEISRETVATPDAVERRSRLSLGTMIPLAIFVALAVMFAIALSSGDPSKIPSALIGKAAPDVRLAPLEGLVRDGQPVPAFSAQDLQAGEVSIVNFWASWCVPCVQEHPLLNEIRERSGVKIYGINYKDPGDGGLKFLTRLGNPFHAVAVDPKGRAAIEWGVYGMPETFVVDGSGTIVHKHIGPISKSDLEATILPAISRARGG